MVEIGLFPPEARLELIEGEILQMAAHTSYHAAAIALVQRRLDQIFPYTHHLRVQLPLALGDHSEPEPDLAVIAGEPSDYWLGHPSTADLVVEIAYSSLDDDQDRKYHLYARHAIPEYWLLNLNERQLEVYRAPQGEEYQTKLILGPGQAIAPLAQPGRELKVDDLLPC